MNLGFGRAFASVHQRPLIRLSFSYVPIDAKKMCASTRAFAGTTRIAYFPIASAIRPTVPTMTRHHANRVKPWRVT